MKNRPPIGAGAGGEGSHKKNSKWSRKKNEKRLGGKGLSLEVFANAKSQNSGYNPWLIKKKREFYKNAKYVSKFKKSVKRENQSQDHPTTLILEDVDGNEKNEAKPLKKNKKKASLESIREEYEKRQAEQEKEKLERMKMIQAKKNEVAIVEARRKESREKMSMRTRSGQPVMRYRIEHLLEGILKNPSA